ncbi:hypothetical protein C8J57DRAFT_1546359 [Mycena rebaudengoi]|nr:hypothetical protein C8J57DRAFT_1546359 [Mycena rebaudengoi]
MAFPTRRSGHGQSSSARNSAPFGHPGAEPTRYPPQAPTGQRLPDSVFHYNYNSTSAFPKHLQPPPGTYDDLVQRITGSVGQMLASHRAQDDERLTRLEQSVNNLISEVAGLRRENKQSAGSFSHLLQQSAGHHMRAADAITRIGHVLGTEKGSANDDQNIMHKLDKLIFDVGEVAECIRDPEANLPDGPVHNEMGTSPIKHVYADAANPRQTPSPRRHVSSVTVGSSERGAAGSAERTTGGRKYARKTMLGSTPQTLSPRRHVSSVAVGSSPDPDLFSERYPSFSTSTAVEEEDSQTDIQDFRKGNGSEGDSPIDSEGSFPPHVTAPPVTHWLAPVDWQDQGCSPNSPEVWTYEPDRLAAPNQPPSSDCTIASLRNASLAVATSTPRFMSIHPISPALSVSPPPSPRHSPSPSPDSPTVDCRTLGSREGSIAIALLAMANRVDPPFEELSVRPNISDVAGGASPRQLSPSPSPDSPAVDYRALGSREGSIAMAVPCRAVPPFEEASVDLKISDVAGEASPRQLSPFLSPDSPAVDYRALGSREGSIAMMELEPQAVPPLEEVSVGRDISDVAGGTSPGAVLNNTRPNSPSTDTLREEHSILDMIAISPSTSHSRIATPQPELSPSPKQLETQIPSSVTPSPMLSTQQLPSPLRLSIPRGPATPTTPTGTSSILPLRIETTLTPAIDVDAEMSPLSSVPATPSPTSLLFASLRDLSPPVKSEPRPGPETTPGPSRRRRTESVLTLKPASAVASAAATRVKKRKSKPQQESDSTPEPPLKRPRQTAHLEKREMSAKKEKGKKGVTALYSAPSGFVWPTVTDANKAGVGAISSAATRAMHGITMAVWASNLATPAFYPMLLTSVLLASPDVRYFPGSVVGCSDLLPLNIGPEVADRDTAEEDCKRPGCKVKVFSLERIAGRHMKLDGVRGRHTRWLILWEKYGWADATWEAAPEPPECWPDQDLQIKRFEERAAAEGFDLDDDEAVIMLREAVEGNAKHPDE